MAGYATHGTNRECEVVEHVGAVLPRIGVSILALALVIEAVHLRSGIHGRVRAAWACIVGYVLHRYAATWLCAAPHGGAVGAKVVASEDGTV